MENINIQYNKDENERISLIKNNKLFLNFKKIFYINFLLILLVILFILIHLFIENKKNKKIIKILVDYNKRNKIKEIFIVV